MFSWIFWNSYIPRIELRAWFCIRLCRGVKGSATTSGSSIESSSCAFSRRQQISYEPLSRQDRLRLRILHLMQVLFLPFTAIRTVILHSNISSHGSRTHHQQQQQRSGSNKKNNRKHPTCKQKTETEKPRMTANTHRSPSCHVQKVEFWHSAALKSNMFLSSGKHRRTDKKRKAQIFCLDGARAKTRILAHCSPEIAPPSAAPDATAANNNSNNSHHSISSQQQQQQPRPKTNWQQQQQQQPPPKKTLITRVISFPSVLR